MINPNEEEPVKAVVTKQIRRGYQFIGLKFLVAVFAVLNVFLVNAQPTQERMPLPQLLDSVERLMQVAKLPGLMLSIVHRDSVVWEGGLGLADPATGEKVTEAHLFRQGSISKSLAALAMLKLAESGYFSLNDELRLVAPEVSFTNRFELTHPIRIVHLLEHTSGFDDAHFSALYNATSREPNSLALLNMHQNSLKTRWLPGSRHAYSNPNYLLVGYLIEKFTNMPFSRYIDQQLLQPLDMRNANFLAFLPAEALYAKGQRWTGEGFVPQDRVMLAGAAGGFNASATDMSKFVQLFLNEGRAGVRVLFTAEQLNRMERPLSGIENKNGRLKKVYGLGNFLIHAKTPFHFNGHNGAVDGHISAFAYNRELAMGFAVAANAKGSLQAIEDLIAHWICQGANSEPLKALPLDAASLKPWLGYYDLANPRLELFRPLANLQAGVRLLVENDSLYLKPWLSPKVLLVPLGNKLFKRVDDQVPTLMLGRTETGTIFLADGFSAYYEKSSIIRPMIFRVLIYGSLLLMLVLLFPGVAWAVAFFRQNLPLPDFLVRFCPVLAAIFFLLALAMAFNLQDIKEAGEFNWKTLGIFLMGPLYCLCALAGLWISSRYYNRFTSRQLAFLLLCINALFVSLGMYLYHSELIGIRLWSY